MATSTMPEKCVECDSPLRKRDDKAEEHPGTKLHFGHGLCASCYGMKRPDRKYNAQTRARLEATQKGLNAFLAERAKREQSRVRRAKLRMVTR